MTEHISILEIRIWFLCTQNSALLSTFQLFNNQLLLITLMENIFEGHTEHISKISRALSVFLLTFTLRSSNSNSLHSHWFNFLMNFECLPLL